VVVEAGTDERTLHAVLNAGENPIVLRTTDGDIRVVVKPNPTHVGRVIR
jgi:hypothetical protein